jgi:hypothetical protein
VNRIARLGLVSLLVLTSTILMPPAQPAKAETTTQIIRWKWNCDTGGDNAEGWFVNVPDYGLPREDPDDWGKNWVGDYTEGFKINCEYGFMYADGRWGDGDTDILLAIYDFGETVEAVELSWQQNIASSSGGDFSIYLVDGPGSHMDWRGYDGTNYASPGAAPYLMNMGGEPYWDTSPHYNVSVSGSGRYLVLSMNATDTAQLDWLTFKYNAEEEEPPDEGLCENHLFDFTTDSEGWLPPPNQDLIINPGGQPEGIAITDDFGSGELSAAGYQDTGSQHLNAWYVYDEPCKVTSLTMRWQIAESPMALPGTALPPIYIDLYQAQDQVLTLAAEYQLVQDRSSYDTWIEYRWYPADARTGFNAITAININWVDHDTLPGGSNTTIGAIWIDWIDIQVGTTSSTLSRPLLPEHEIDFGLFDTPFQYDYEAALTAFSANWGDPVHAINAGTVTSVQPTLINDPNLCNSFFGLHRGRWSAAAANMVSAITTMPGWGRPDASCMLSHPQLPVGTQFNFLSVMGIAENIYRFISGRPTAPKDIFVDLRDTYTVVVDSDIGNVHYFVQRPTVQPGDTVFAGCQLGYTAGYYAESMNVGLNPVAFVEVTVNTFSAMPLAQGGITLVAVEDIGPVILEPALFTETPGGIPCANNGAFSDQCINRNPTFTNHAEGWLRTNDTSIVLPDGGLRITGMVYHEAVIALDPAGEYSIVVEAHLEQPAPDGQDSVLEIGLGDTTPPNAPLEVPIPASGDTTRFSVPPQTWPENYSGGQYELYLNPRLFNSGTIVVTFICISDDAADPVNLPSACYFADPDFNSGDGWTTSSGAVNGDPIFASGAATIPYSAHVNQTVTLTPGDYTIEYTGRLHPQLFTGEPYIELGWTFDTHSGGMQLPNTFWENSSDPFTVSATTTAAFSFAAVNGTNADETAIQLDRVCIVPATGPPATGGSSGSYGTCAVCNYTANGDIAHDIVEMITWLACVITNLWTCEIYPIAQGTWDGVLEIVRGVGMLGRYLAYSFKITQEFLLSLVYYIAGYIYNVGLRVTEAAGGNVVYIEQSGSMNLWDVLGALITGLRDVIVTALDDILAAIYLLLNFLTPVVTTLATVILSIINILVTVLNALLAQVLIVPMMAERMIVAFVTASATPIPGMPNCSVLNSNPLCLGIYVIDNTILSGPAQMLLPVVLAAATVWVVLWTMDRFSQAFR